MEREDDVDVLREDNGDGGKRCDVMGRNGWHGCICHTHLIWVAKGAVELGNDTPLSSE